MQEIVPGIGLATPLADADALLAQLDREVDLSVELVDEGRGPVPTPRSTGWYGDPLAAYTYSGLERRPKGWTPGLAGLRNRLNASLAIDLNSCLVGLYEDGTNVVDWHADDEPELRDRIVSVSLGASRRFHLRRGPQGVPFAITLEHGSVLVMTVASQHVWQHAVLSEPGAGRRLNLTFRVIAHE